MKKSEAVALWRAIIDYGDICKAVGEEGNSGEFYDKEEAQRLDDKFRETIGRLMVLFSRATGYLPIPIEEDGEVNDWKLKKLDSRKMKVKLLL